MTSAIQFQFSTDGTLSSAVICWFGGGAPLGVSHVDTVVDEVGLPWVVEKAPKVQVDWLLGARLSGGIQVRSPDYAKFTRRILVTVPAEPAQVATFWQFQAAQIGKPYDWRSIAGFAIGRDWREPDSWMCSELEARSLEVAGIVPRLFAPDSKITPEMLVFGLSMVPGVVVNAL